MYLNVKIRSSEDIDNYGTEMQDKEKDRLKATDSLTIIEYAKASIEILLNIKQEESDENK